MLKEEKEKLIRSDLPLAEIADLTGLSARQISNRRHYLKRRAGSYVADAEEHSGGTWKEQFAKLSVKYNRAMREHALVETLVEEIRDLAPKSYATAPKIVSRKVNKRNTPQSAVLLFSDTHVGKEVKPEQTLGFGRYNFRVFLARLKFLEDSIVSIVQDHTPSPTTELVIAMLGDMLDGSLAHSVEAGQRVTKFSQFYGAGHAIAQFIRNLAPHFPLVRIRTVVGNHTRWDNQRKMPTENRFSNLDQFLYALVQALTVDIKNVDFPLNCQPFSLFKSSGHTFLASHGDHLRGGDKAFGIPLHAMARDVSTRTQLMAKASQQAPHYYLCGHLHRNITLPHALGDIIVNGGFPGLDNYALAENFNPVDPAQRFFFVHPRFGRVAEYQIALKFAKADGPLPYTIPGDFPME